MKKVDLYYLNSRYYDPETGRFISPDVLSILDETKGQINGLNLYIYCNDNPIMYTDDSGCLPEWLKRVSIGAAILGVALVVGAITVLTCGIGCRCNNCFNMWHWNNCFSRNCCWSRVA